MTNYFPGTLVGCLNNQSGSGRWRGNQRGEEEGLEEGEDAGTLPDNLDS